MRHALSRGWPFFPAKAFPVNVVPRCGYIAASPRGETACVRPTGILAKRNTPKKARKFKHLEPPSAKVEKSAGSTAAIAVRPAGDDVARTSGGVDCLSANRV